MPAHEPVTVRILDDPDATVRGIVANLSEGEEIPRGVGLLIERPIPAGTAVRVDLADAMLLGEICYCRSARPLETGLERESWYAAGLECEHWVPCLANLTRLLQQVMGGSGERLAESQASQ